MKIRFASLLIALAGASSVWGAPLTEPSAVQTQPDPNSPVITVLKAGSEVTLTSGPVSPLPSGWIAVQIQGPFVVYVQNKDLTKQLDVKVGTPLLLSPKPDGGVLEVFAKGDKTEITGLHGTWTQLTLDKTLVGYLRVSGASQEPAPEVQAAPAQSGATAVYPPATGEDAPLARTFEGKFASTRRPFMPRRPYDWQLLDSSGNRYAYLDIQKLLLTDQIENFADRSVVVFGTAKPAPGGKDLVIEAESLRLK